MQQSSPSWKIFVLIVAALLLSAFVPVPYVIQSPGPTFNTLGEFDGEEVIEVDGHTTYVTDGNLDLTTVMVSGGPGRNLTSADLFFALLDPAQDIVPSAAVYPEQVSREDVDQENQQLMEHSQMDAVAAALHELQIDYTRKFVVQGFSAETGAEGVLEVDDEILTADGKDISGVVGLRQQLADLDADTIDLGVIRDGQHSVIAVPVITDSSGDRVIGVYLSNSYEFPFDISVSLGDVGGPSAGLMFSLGIVDKLTLSAMTGGEFIAGTGTIDADGTVGAIGGIPQKVVGAKEMGAEFFLAPEDNCEELSGRVPDGLAVFPVENLAQARKIVEQLGESSDPASVAAELEQCG